MPVAGGGNLVDGCCCRYELSELVTKRDQFHDREG